MSFWHCFSFDMYYLLFVSCLFDIALVLICIIYCLWIVFLTLLFDFSDSQPTKMPQVKPVLMFVFNGKCLSLMLMLSFLVGYIWYLELILLLLLRNNKMKFKASWIKDFHKSLFNEKNKCYSAASWSFLANWSLSYVVYKIEGIRARELISRVEMRDNVSSFHFFCQSDHYCWRIFFLHYYDW